uniref:Uncharacterized protein n=1 Tax=Chenopodium quinoa TaxID=63459 RepID=A0A803L2U6_CHEQI
MAAPKLPISILNTTVKSMANDRTMLRSPASKPQQRPTMSAFEARVSLLFALASQSASVSQRVVADLVAETSKYVVPKRFESRNLE